MDRRVCLLPTALLTAAFLICGCGSSNRLLTSIAVAPADAHASGSTGAQFTATGTFSASPLTVSPLTVHWSITGSTTIPQPSQVSIDNNGLAHCNGFKGSVPIIASHDAADPKTLPPGFGAAATVTGKSSLICD